MSLRDLEKIINSDLFCNDVQSKPRSNKTACFGF